VFSTQFFVYSPVNFRKFFNIPAEKNPKAIGLFLSSYCRLYKAGLIEKEDFENLYSKFVKYLQENKSEDFTNYCWGFNFDWQDITRFSRRGLPTVVISTYVGNSFLDLYDISEEKKYLEIADSISKFILEDLNITETDKGICFSYTPIDNHVVHNANCLGAAFLSRVYSITKEKKLLDYSKKAFDFSISFQNNDGSWAYGLNPKNKKQRNQIDFHQGFILDSIIDFLRYTKKNYQKYKESLTNGSRFYINKQFLDLERSKWRLPFSFPVDIHHQAQGIITLCKLFEIFKNDKYLDIAKKITKWTIENMQDKQGYFYYQKWPFFTNKISYMRWSQAWMMLALSSLLYIDKEEFIDERDN
jgi:rhamnogalacturonyl hydrolase YesR